MKKIIIILLMLKLIFADVTGLKYLMNVFNFNVITLDLDYKESTNTLHNPERGWYLIDACMVNDNYEEGNSVYKTLENQHKEGDVLVLVLLNISNYRNREISKDGMQYISNVLNSVRKVGMKAIIRFVYDWDGKGLEFEPDSLGIVTGHMEQIAAELNENKDIIYLVQGILVGSYGEMNGSKYLDQKNYTALLSKYLEVLDPGILIAVRTPVYWRIYNQTDNPVSNFTQLPGARIGLFNDGLCSSDIDLGTYSGETGDTNNFSSKWVRSKELEFQSRLCQYVPNGGEIAQDSKYNDIDHIAEEFPVLHISYLNRGYNEDVLQKWKDTQYHSDNQSDPYRGADGYKYVQDHLGYRFVLRRVSIPKVIYDNTNPVISVQIENTGFSNLYYQKNVSVIIEGKNTGEISTIPVDTDIRIWKSDATTSLLITLPIRDMKDSSFNLYLKITDDMGNCIQMANNNIFDTKINANRIGSIEVKKLTLENIWK